MILEPKAKYRLGGWAKKVRAKSSGDGKLGEGKKHHKASDKVKRSLKPQPRMMMVLGPTGKRKMVRL